jgi:hypothetical protein
MQASGIHYKLFSALRSKEAIEQCKRWVLAQELKKSQVVSISTSETNDED